MPKPARRLVDHACTGGTWSGCILFFVCMLRYASRSVPVAPFAGGGSGQSGFAHVRSRSNPAYTGLRTPSGRAAAAGSTRVSSAIWHLPKRADASSKLGRSATRVSGCHDPERAGPARRGPKRRWTHAARLVHSTFASRSASESRSPPRMPKSSVRIGKGITISCSLKAFLISVTIWLRASNQSVWCR